MQPVLHTHLCGVQADVGTYMFWRHIRRTNNIKYLWNVSVFCGLSSVDRSTCVRAFSVITHTAVIFSTGSPGQRGSVHDHLLERQNNHLVTPFPHDTHLTDYMKLQLMSRGNKRMAVTVCGNQWVGICVIKKSFHVCTTAWGLLPHIWENEIQCCFNLITESN